MTLPHRLFWTYLVKVYERMAREIPPDANVLEVCTRTYRGVMTPELIPCRHFVAVDRDDQRPGFTVDVLEEPVSADAIISTAILHHTDEENIPRLLANLRAPLLLFNGPTADTHEPYGDHRWHLEESKLRRWLGELGYSMTWERIGLTEPLCEALVVARRPA